MAGDESITYGDALICGISIKSRSTKMSEKIDYCPQFEAFFDELTGRQNIELFGLLHGISSSQIDTIVHQLATELNFMKYLDKISGTWSGGNKRKLSTAIAFLGNPSVILLDEPTSGMDPSARRSFWNVICKVRDSGKTIVLTTHNMDECEALCTRLTIMVRGEFKCLGSVQHLKNKFAVGFILTVNVGISNENK